MGEIDEELLPAAEPDATIAMLHNRVARLTRELAEERERYEKLWAAYAKSDVRELATRLANAQADNESYRRWLAEERERYEAAQAEANAAADAERRLEAALAEERERRERAERLLAAAVDDKRPVIDELDERMLLRQERERVERLRVVIRAREEMDIAQKWTGAGGRERWTRARRKWLESMDALHPGDMGEE